MGERFNLRKLYELDVRKQYQIEITNRFAALDNLSDVEDTHRAWENMKENQNLSSRESMSARTEAT
jgi:flagellin-specific chaperone FliS